MSELRSSQAKEAVKSALRRAQKALANCYIWLGHWSLYCEQVRHVQPVYLCFVETILNTPLFKAPQKKGNLLTCVVQSVFPFGAFVCLEDGSQGYIRKRELTLSGEVDPRDVVEVGQQIEAAALDLAVEGKTLELSIKATFPDPWPGFVQQHKVGDPVGVTAKHLYTDGVLVEIVPGVDGFVPLRELALGEPVAQPEEAIWPGDRSEAIITHIDHTTRRVQLSIRRRANRLATVESILGFMRREAPTIASREQHSEEVCSDEPAAGPIAIRGPVLVVEDQQDLRDPFVEWLSSLGCVAVGAPSAAVALQKCTEQDFCLAIVDLDMPEVDGLSLIHELRRLDYGMTIAVMSGPDMIAEKLSILRETMVGAAFPKPLNQDEIRHALLQMTRGEELTFSLELDEQPLPQEIQDFQSLAGMMRASGSTADRLQRGLDQLVSDVRADCGVLFRMDLASRTVSVVAQAGQSGLRGTALYDLISSPVKDVIVEGGILWENRASSKQGRFRKLLDALTFESCIGIPLEVAGRTEHALFLFDRAWDAFSPSHLRDALALAHLFCALLEHQGLEQRVQTVSTVLLSGQLASAFGHEVYNKVSGLDLQISNVRARLLQALQTPEPVKDGKLKGVADAMDQVAEMATALKQTVQDFQRLTRSSETQLVDINRAVIAAKAMVNPLALRQKTQINLELGADVPHCMGSSIRLQQVILNLMLNAVQHMGNRPEERRVLRVTTASTMADDTLCVEIRFSDSGPGIHHKLWEKVFELGYTTRTDGSGLGLYIARSLVESIHGSITINDSLMELGTTFLVQLPALAAPLPGLGATL